MLSRVAENLYWMGRYLERAENTARLINSTTEVVLDLPRGTGFGWDGLLKVAGLDQVFAERHPGVTRADEDLMMPFLIEDEANPSSILSSIRQARENARSVREVLPMELWERINRLYLFARDNAARALRGRGPRADVLHGVIGHRESIIGLLTGSMSRDIAYQCITLGRNLERADMTTRIIDVNTAVSLPADPALATVAAERMWMSTLNALSAYQMYRRQVSVRVRAERVIDFLLRDHLYPRTVLHCLTEIEDCLSAFPDPADALAAMVVARQRVAALAIDATAPKRLHEDLDRIQRDLDMIHATVARQYFHLHQQPVIETADTTQ